MAPSVRNASGPSKTTPRHGGPSPAARLTGEIEIGRKGPVCAPDIRASGAHDAEPLAVLDVVRSQLPTSQLKDPLRDRVCVAMQNPAISSDKWGTRDETAPSAHQ